MKFRSSSPKSSQSRLHSIHVLQAGKDFHGRIEHGRIVYEFTFSPSVAVLRDGRPVLSGAVTVKSRTGRPRRIDGIEASLMATQGNIHSGPPEPRSIDPSLKPEDQNEVSLPLTDATGPTSSVGVLYWKLSPLDGRKLGLPLDTSSVQMNARLYPASELERDLQWLYSALTMASMGDPRDDLFAAKYLEELNRRFK